MQFLRELRQGVATLQPRLRKLRLNKPPADGFLVADAVRASLGTPAQDNLAHWGILMNRNLWHGCSLQLVSLAGIGRLLSAATGPWAKAPAAPAAADRITDPAATRPQRGRQGGVGISDNGSHRRLVWGG